MMRILFVGCGIPGIHDRFDHDIYCALKEDPGSLVWRVAPQNLSPALLQQIRPEVLLVAHGSKTPLNLVRYARKLGSTTVLWILEDPLRSTATGRDGWQLRLCLYQ